jgi:uncharacterized membrane protein YgcG
MERNGKMKILAIMLLLLATISTLSLFVPKVTAYGTRGRYVYDRADVLKAEEESQLESYLLDLDKNTTVEIVVFTLPYLTKDHGIKDSSGFEIHDIDSLKEQVFNDLPLETPTGHVTGIGKADLDNGLLIIVTGFATDATEEDKKWGIEVGYELEGNITDAFTVNTANDYLVLALKDGNVFKAFYDTAVVLANKAGYTAVAPPKTGIEIDPAIGVIILVFVIVVMFVLVGVFIGRSLYERYKKWQERKKRINIIKDSLRDHETDNEKMSGEITGLEEKAKKFPPWAQKDATDMLKSCRDNEHEIQSIIDESGRIYKENPEVAEDGLEKIRTLKVLTSTTLFTVGSKMPKMIEDFQKDAPIKLNKSKISIIGARRLLSAKEKEGLIIDDQIEELKNLEKQVVVFESSLAQYGANHREICENADTILRKVDDVRQEILRRIIARDEVNASLKDLPNSLTRIEKGIPHAVRLLSEIKEKHHPDVWNGLEVNLNSTPEIIEAARADLASAEKHNSMENQAFYKAQQEIIDARSQIELARRNVDAVFNLKEELHKAKNEAPGLLNNARVKVREAGLKINHSDVGGQARHYVGIAKQRVSQAEEMYSEAKSNKIINWILLVAILTEVITLSDRAMEQARRDKEEAEEERARRRRRREQEERDSYYHHSSWSGGGGYSGGGGGGGGASGGGGGSGNW